MKSEEAGGARVDLSAAAYVPLAWAEAVPLRGTPTTLLVGGDGRLAWSHLGALGTSSGQDLDKAMSRLRGQK